MNIKKIEMIDKGKRGKCLLFNSGHDFSLTSDALPPISSWNSAKTIGPELKIKFVFLRGLFLNIY